MRIVIFGLIFVYALPAYAKSYTDVPQSREDYIAVEDLTSRGIFEGRPDGTFGPDDFVNRAEAITIVVRAVANEKNIISKNNCFPDVYGDDWYVKYICYAEDLGWISGYPDGTFQPIRTVSKVEFLKILLNAYGVDTETLNEFTNSIARDVEYADAWYFPYMKYALASSMTSADSFENLNPGIALTRGQVALLTDRFLLYREGGRDQSLLTFAEKDIRSTFDHLDSLNVYDAKYAISRARLAIEGVAMRSSEEGVIDATIKLIDSATNLVDAYIAVKSGDLDRGVTLSQNAYNESATADSMTNNVKIYTDRIRGYAHELANQIRSYEE